MNTSGDSAAPPTDRGADRADAEGSIEEVDVSPTCRICLGEGTVRGDPATDPEDRLISPCLCKGTVRYVHVGCLQQWRRTAHGRSDSALRCGQCRYLYNIRQTTLALFLMSDEGALALAALAIVSAVHLLGLVGYAATTQEKRSVLYHWLRLGYHRGGGAVWLRETTYGEIITLGGTSLGCLTFAHYALGRTLQYYALHREGMIDNGRIQAVGLLFCWIYTEIVQNKSGRGPAVVGLFMACYHSYEGAIMKAKSFAQWLGETILEPTAADRQRHEREQQEQQQRLQQETR